MEHPLLHYVMEHMSVVGNRSEHKYVEKIKSEGAVRLLEPDNCPNGWACPPGDIFKVRGPDYLTTKVKIQAGDYVLKPIGFDWIKGSAKIAEVLKNPNSRVRKVIDDEFQTEGSLIDQFLKGDDVFRNSRLKLIANIVKGPWIVRKAVGEQAVCIIGRALTCKYCVTENFFEVDVDIGSSVVASAIVHLAFGYITMLTVDIAFLIEGQTESELPEKLLGAFRFSDLNPASAHSFESSSYESSDSLQTSLPTRFWKSLGQGFSQLLHPGAQDSPTAIMAHANGNSKHEDDNEVVKKW
ncbi:protein ENHANCED DISEASE RESISTANCE 2 isoform X4 [Mercurialis annua]|uniref:protein ENHANCED DISEASE RESISTANCE 2 isoform X4 n=1 Tax=Mercurialis annua TaxID=3986 RepID=UPI00216109F0|nr:protein ENHANCED DISEASE RESISTANCE 2 isoform X4 [Mercurialis annua]